MRFVGGPNPCIQNPTDSGHLEKIEKSPYFGRGLNDVDDIWHNDAV